MTIYRHFYLIGSATFWVVALISIGGCCLISNYMSENEITITVKEKERVAEQNGARYLIWSEDETFQDADSLIKGKFDSSDLYGQLEEGKTYTCLVYGWRNSFFSMYRNIINCREVQ